MAWRNITIVCTNTVYTRLSVKERIQQIINILLTYVSNLPGLLSSNKFPVMFLERITRISNRPRQLPRRPRKSLLTISGSIFRHVSMLHAPFALTLVSAQWRLIVRPSQLQLQPIADVLFTLTATRSTWKQPFKERDMVRCAYELPAK